MQRIGRFAGDRDQSWPIRVPVLPVAAARSSQLPAGALDTPDRLLDLDGHAWTVGRPCGRPRRAASGWKRNVTTRPSRHLTDRPVLRLAKPRTSNRASPTRGSSAPRSSSSSARLCPSLASNSRQLRSLPSCPSPRLACRRLASRRLCHAWACLTRFLRQVEEGVSSASAVDTLPRGPGVERNLNRSRGGGLVIS